MTLDPRSTADGDGCKRLWMESRGYVRVVRRLAMILLAVALAAIWPLDRAVTNHSFTAIIGAGIEGPSIRLLAREVPDLVVADDAGHDGQQFYAVARAPFDPPRSKPYLDTPSYRYRRILMPALAWLAAPHGGVRLIFVLMVLGLVGVALSAWALSFFPGAPWWLAPIIGVTPGIVVSTALSLSDSLALGFTLAAFALTMHRRPMLAVWALTLGALTRETVVLAAIALAVTPWLTTRARLAYVCIPSAAVLAWTMWESHVLGQSINSGAADQFSFPLSGWLHSDSDIVGLVVGLLLAMVMIAGLIRTRDEPPVCVYLGLQLLLMSTLSSYVTLSWVNTTRAVIAGFPLSAWGIVRERT